MRMNQEAFGCVPHRCAAPREHFSPRRFGGQSSKFGIKQYLQRLWQAERSCVWDAPSKSAGRLRRVILNATFASGMFPPAVAFLQH